MRKIWQQHKKWFILGAVSLAVAIAAAALRQSPPPVPRTEAEPPSESAVTFNMEKNRAYTAADGVVVIPASELKIENTELEVEESPAAMLSNRREAAPSFSSLNSPFSTQYTLPEDAQMADRSIGLLTIPKLSLAVNAYESADEMEAMTQGVAHFKTTSSWNGNIGLCSHNVNMDLTDGYFKNLHTLKTGDAISYRTALGTRTYTVQTVAEIAETDWSYLNRTEDNRVTLITCISGKPASRLVVQAVSAD